MTPYDVLGVDPNASEAEIKSTYRKRIKESHPDLGGSSKEFQRVKQSYEQIVAGKSYNSHAQSQTQGTGKQNDFVANCAFCNSSIESPKEAVYRESKDDLYCSQCVVDTNCTQCGSSLTLTVDHFAELKGKPVCMSCSQSSQASRSNIPLWIYLVGGALIGFLLYQYWYYRPTVTLNLEPYMGAIDAIVGPGLFILIWAIWRYVK